MARYIYFYRPEAISITFEAATTGYFPFALSILRAKVFDICRILTYMMGQGRWSRTRALSIRFRGGKDPDRPELPRKSFWEMRPRMILPKWIVLYDKRAGKIVKKSKQGRESYPFFYECLMLPLFSCYPWIPNAVYFDSEPAKRHSSFFEKNVGDNDGQVEYFGFQELFKMAVAYHKYRRRAKRVDYYDECLLEFDNVMDRFGSFTNCMSGFLDVEVRCREADQLQDYLLRMRRAHTCNPFAGPWEESPTQEKSKKLRGNLIPWRCWGEDSTMREQYIQWALDE